MIYQQALRRELAYTTGAVFLVLVTIMMTTLVIRILGFAASGSVSPKDVVVLISLAIFGYLAIILTVSLFISVLLVLIRWHRDSEMVVWFASGLSLQAIYRPVLRFALPLVLIIAVLALFVWPWTNLKSSELSQRFKGRDEISMILPGQFIESVKSNRVFFIENIDETDSTIQNVFVTDIKGDKLSVAMAEKGHIQNLADGTKQVKVENGRRYEGQPSQGDFRILEFDTYTVDVERKAPAPITPSSKELSTKELITNSNPHHLGELLWRLGLPLMALGLTLIAVPLAYVNPRRGNYSAMLIAVFIYLIYSNFLNISQTLVSSGKQSFEFSLWPVHLGAAAVAWILLRHRSNYSLPWWKRQLNFWSSKK
jgi:lipopolysaccharide export system permease protein